MPAPAPFHRPPRTLWVYTFADLARLIILSGAVLVTVIAFTSTVRYTAEGKLGPLETLRFMIYIMPPMLQYALPFAAGFGATLAFHRMTQDNELTAAHAGGISHRAILAPALFTGVIIATILFYLSGQIIPRFARSAEQLITLDATKVLENSIRAGRSVEVAGKVFYADNVYKIETPPKDATDQLVLTNVAALELGPAGKVAKESFTQRAWLTFYRSSADAPDDPVERPDKTLTLVVLSFESNQTYEEGKGLGTAESGGIIHPISGGVRDDPKFLTTSELAELPDHPDRYGDINTFRRGLALGIIQHQWLKSIDAALRKDRRVRLVDPEKREYIVHAAALDRAGDTWVLRPLPGRDVEVERLHPAAPGKTAPPGTRFVAKSAHLAPEKDETQRLRGVSLGLTMMNVSGQSLNREELGDQESSGGVGVTTEKTYGRLTFPDSTQNDLLGMPSLKLLSEIESRGLGADPAIGPAAADLRQRITNLGKHVLSKQHERAAHVAACLVMVVTGAVTALRLGSCLPLTVYLWSFFPAILTILTISAGQHATRSMGYPGLIILWGGVAFLAVYAGIAFAAAKKH
jgi:hypothetical protein